MIWVSQTLQPKPLALPYMSQPPSSAPVSPSDTLDGYPLGALDVPSSLLHMFCPSLIPSHSMEMQFIFKPQHFKGKKPPAYYIS